MSTLTFRNVSLRYPPRAARIGADEKLVLEGINLQIASDELVAIIGRSGSGKTSLLNLAAGFLEPTAGSIAVDGVPIDGPGADRAVVFQDDALYPWLDARDNIALPFKLKGVPRAARRRTSFWPVSALPMPATGGSGSFPAACASGSVLPGHWPPNRVSCCSTNRSARSTP